VNRNGANIPVVQSRFFDSIDFEFDTVVFNPPYVTTEEGARRGLTGVRETQWNGGVDGSSVIAGFLEQMGKLPKRVTAYLAINFLHLPRSRMRMVIEKHADRISLIEVVKHSILPVDVYILVNDMPHPPSTAS
jgi:methylase of polypeptide subunit release factors